MDAVKQEIIDLLKEHRFNEVTLLEMHPLAQVHEQYPRWAQQVDGEEAYEVTYHAKRFIAPWDRYEIGTRRAHVARLVRGVRGLMGLLWDAQEGPVNVESIIPAPLEEIEDAF
jgi:hypothetical protein